MAYSDKVLDHYENPRNVGSFRKTEEGVGTGMVGPPACPGPYLPTTPGDPPTRSPTHATFETTT